MLTGQPCR